MLRMLVVLSEARDPRELQTGEFSYGKAWVEAKL
jgi:hypothetical protein